VLLIVFGTLVSSGLPLGLAISSIAIAVGLTTILGHIFSLSFFVTNMIVMIGLAVGIDYALFIVGRYREERQHGLDVAHAVVRAGDSASKAVLFSGMTVVVALLGMLIVPSSIFMSLGAGAIIVVIVSVAATLTLLPAVLMLLGNKINRGTDRTLTGVLAVFLLAFAALFAFGLDVHIAFALIYAGLGILALIATVLNLHIFRMRASGEGGFWDRISGFVMRHPVALVSGASVALAGIALIYFTISLGQSGITTLPEETSPRTAFELLESEFTGMSLEDPNIVVVDATDVNAPEVQTAIDNLIGLTSADGEFGPATVEVNEAGNLAMISLPAASDTQSTAALHSIDRLRDDYIPVAFQGSNAEALVTGPSAETVDFNSVVDTYTPIVFVFVLGMSLILLLLAFRSIVVPIKSVIMNLLSVGASYGLLVAVFQHGWGNELFGFNKVDRIDAWIPLMMFTILFGLSMDYHVFLLSRIKEHYDLTGNNAESVAYGLRSTAAIITGAALIMVAVFGGFAMGQLSMFQQMGFGLATAVILDASVVRVFLVPAGMKLLNDWNWYFPNWLGWLPKINVEGLPIHEPEAAPAPAGAGD
jgi:RND superfamily putative drug exporter